MKRKKHFKNQTSFEVWVINEKHTRIIINDVYYKATNTHDYFSYTQVHNLKNIHLKNDVPHNLAKRTSVFVWYLVQIKKTIRGN